MASIAELSFNDRPSTTIVHRPFAGGAYRRVTDRASRVSIEAFPMAMVGQLSAAGLLPASGAYIICDDRTAYIGESVKLPRRLVEHASDIAKASFARDVYVVTGSDRSGFDKLLVMDLQYRLTGRALDTSLVVINKGANPAEVDMPDPDRSSNDQLFADALRLLHDAGCWFLQPRTGPLIEPADREEPGSDDTGDTADAGPITIGVSTTPVGSEEFELTYDGIWARGYWREGHFIVAAGSEIRMNTNTSCNALTRQRRDDLLRSGVLARIPGVDGRSRLTAAVAFPSTSIAAKALCGAHTTPRWLPIAAARVIVLDGLRQN